MVVNIAGSKAIDNYCICTYALCVELSIVNLLEVTFTQKGQGTDVVSKEPRLIPLCCDGECP